MPVMLMLLLWAIAVSFSFFGWGALAFWVMRFPRMPLALTGAFGAGVAVLIGGFLNIGGLLWMPVLRAFVLTGATLFAIELVMRSSEILLTARNGLAIVRRKPVLGALALLVCLLAMLLALTAVRRKVFAGDDTVAYLAFTIKTPLLGSIPADPFSDRRIKSSLGSNYFLKALMLPDGDFRSTGFPDTGFGYLLFVALAYHLGRELLPRRKHALALAALAGALPFERANEQMYMLPAALFLACFLFTLRAAGWRQGVLLGITGAAAATMKSSYTPFAMSMLGLYYVLHAQKLRWRRISGSLAAATASFLLILLPWMADSKTKNGTWFYPIFGDGFHVTAYLSRFPELRIHNASLLTFASFAPLSAALAVLSVLIFLDRESGRGNENTTACAVAFAAAAALSTAVVGYATAGEAAGRYSLPFIYPATLVAFTLFFQRWLRKERRTAIISTGLGLAAAWTVFLVAYYGAIQEWGDYHEYPIEIKSLFSDLLRPIDREVLTDANLRRIVRDTQAWQSKVPTGEPIFAATIRSEGVDFSRNPFYVADTPGMASLPPGMPFKEPEELRSYFRENHIRYVVFAEYFDDEGALKEALAYKGRRVVVTRETIASCETRLTLKKLKNECEVVYDDGRLCVMRVY
jgi:hypothetical protein